jgi:DNA-directed RNA polymerase subunit RPC12/RpoP
MAGARREIKLPYRELYISCPHCRIPLVVGTIMDKLLMSRRNCSQCGKEFLIENDVPRKPDSKKPSGSVGPTKAKKSNRAKLR